MVHERRAVAEVECFGKEKEDADEHEGVADGRELEYPAPPEKLTNYTPKNGCDMTAISCS